MKLNKKTLIIASLITLFLLLAVFINYYIYRDNPEKEVEKAIESSDIENYLSSSLLTDLDENMGVNKEYYLDNVSNYETTREIQSLNIESETKSEAVALIELLSTTQNTKTEFTYTTIDTYRVWLIWEDRDWKIDKIEKIKSEEAN